MHKRQAIREAVKALLLGHTNAGNAVYVTRKAPVGAPSPAIAIYTLGESAADEDTAPRILKRSLDLMIEVFAAGETADNQLDDLSVQIEAAMHQDETLGGIVDDCVLSDTEAEFFLEGAKLVGLLRMVYQVTYRQQAFVVELTDPNISDFTDGNVTTDVNSTSDADEDTDHDQFTMET
jgi:hypothetical protein